MKNLTIKCHKPGTAYTKPHFFILNKGINCGKPQKVEFINSFVLTFSNQEECENYYFIAFSLWKTNFWHQFLAGSVILFIHINDFKKEFLKKGNAIALDEEKHQKNVAALKFLEQHESQLQKNISLINDLRKAILYSYFK